MWWHMFDWVWERAAAPPPQQVTVIWTCRVCGQHEPFCVFTLCLYTWEWMWQECADGFWLVFVREGMTLCVFRPPHAVYSCGLLSPPDFAVVSGHDSWVVWLMDWIKMPFTWSVCPIWCRPDEYLSEISPKHFTHSNQSPNIYILEETNIHIQNHTKTFQFIRGTFVHSYGRTIYATTATVRMQLLETKQNKNLKTKIDTRRISHIVLDHRHSHFSDAKCIEKFRMWRHLCLSVLPSFHSYRILCSIDRDSILCAVSTNITPIKSIFGGSHQLLFLACHTSWWERRRRWKHRNLDKYCRRIQSNLKRKSSNIKF